MFYCMLHPYDSSQKNRRENKISDIIRSVKLATGHQLLVAGYLFREKLATSSKLLVTEKT